MIGVTIPRIFAVEEKTTMTILLEYVKWDQNGKSHYILYYFYGATCRTTDVSNSKILKKLISFYGQDMNVHIVCLEKTS
jgi:hypothetical protein